jgi:hypothetical protein
MNNKEIVQSYKTKKITHKKYIKKNNLTLYAIALGFGLVLFHIILCLPICILWLFGKSTTLQTIFIILPTIVMNYIPLISMLHLHVPPCATDNSNENKKCIILALTTILGYIFQSMLYTGIHQITFLKSSGM